METTLFVKTSEKIQILTNNVFRPENEPYTAKLSSSGVLKHFRGN